MEKEEYCIIKDGTNIEVFYNLELAINFAGVNDADKILLVKYGPENEYGDSPEISAETVWENERKDVK